MYVGYVHVLRTRWPRALPALLSRICGTTASVETPSAQTRYDNGSFAGVQVLLLAVGLPLHPSRILQADRWRITLV